MLCCKVTGVPDSEKSSENQLRFNRVTAMSLVSNFFGTPCKDVLLRCLVFQSDVCVTVLRYCELFFVTLLQFAAYFCANCLL